eukprot:Ihof_evm13s5 gene=Ihof_evmTU13s5
MNSKMLPFRQGWAVDLANQTRRYIVFNNDFCIYESEQAFNDESEPLHTYKAENHWSVYIDKDEDENDMVGFIFSDQSTPSDDPPWKIDDTACKYQLVFDNPSKDPRNEFFKWAFALQRAFSGDQFVPTLFPTCILDVANAMGLTLAPMNCFDFLTEKVDVMPVQTLLFYPKQSSEDFDGQDSTLTATACSLQNISKQESSSPTPMTDNCWIDTYTQDLHLLLIELTNNESVLREMKPVILLVREQLTYLYGLDPTARRHAIVAMRSLAQLLNSARNMRTAVVSHEAVIRLQIAHLTLYNAIASMLNQEGGTPVSLESILSSVEELYVATEHMTSLQRAGYEELTEMLSLLKQYGTGNSLTNTSTVTSLSSSNTSITSDGESCFSECESLGSLPEATPTSPSPYIQGNQDRFTVSDDDILARLGGSLRLVEGTTGRRRTMYNFSALPTVSGRLHDKLEAVTEGAARYTNVPQLEATPQLINLVDQSHHYSNLRADNINSLKNNIEDNDPLDRECEPILTLAEALSIDMDIDRNSPAWPFEQSPMTNITPGSLKKKNIPPLSRPIVNNICDPVFAHDPLGWVTNSKWVASPKHRPKHRKSPSESCSSRKKSSILGPVVLELEIERELYRTTRSLDGMYSNNDLNARSDDETIKTKQTNQKLLQFFGHEVEVKDDKMAYLLRENYDVVLLSGDNNVKGGTLESLLKLLTRHEKADPKFVRMFLMMYKQFMGAEELLDHLWSRFTLQPPPDLDERERQYVIDQKISLVQLSVMRVLQSWIRNFFGDIGGDSVILVKVINFALRICYLMPSYGQAVLELLHTKMFAEKGITNFRTTPDDPMIITDDISSNFWKIDPVEIAQQCTVIEWQLFKAIDPREFLNQSWTKASLRHKTPNIIAFIERSSQVTHWVVNTILGANLIKDRVWFVRYFIQLAWACQALNNFSTMMAVLGGLNSAAIHRLRLTWEKLPDKNRQQLEQMNEIMDSKGNCAAYRRAIHNVVGPRMPFLGTYLTDLVFIDDTLPRELPNRDNFINVEKLRKTYNIIVQLQHLQANDYQLTPKKEIITYLLGTSEKASDPEENYNLSLQLE